MTSTAAKTIKATCTRCGGTGSYSFNLIDGTKCYGCMGHGFKLVDAAKEARAAKARADRAAKQAEQAAQRAALAASVAAELDAEFGPFTNDMKGAQDRVWACQRAYGCTPGDIVQRRLQAA